MLNYRKCATYFSVVIITLLTISSAYAKDAKVIPPAPVPPQIAAATKVFIANGGADDFGAIAEKEALSGARTRAYDEFYAAMKDWGHYQIVSTPGEADLVLEISWSFSNLKEPLETFSNTPIDLGRLTLTIIDCGTHITLWVYNEHVRSGTLISSRNKNFEQAMDDLVTDMKNLVPAPGTTSKSSN